MLAPTFNTAAPGSKRESTILVADAANAANKTSVEVEEDRSLASAQSTSAPKNLSHLPLISDEAMEAANRGDKNFALYRRTVTTVKDDEEPKAKSLNVKKQTGRRKKK